MATCLYTSGPGRWSQVSVQDVKSRFCGCAMEEPKLSGLLPVSVGHFGQSSGLGRTRRGAVAGGQMSLPLILFMSGRCITAEIRLKGRKTALSGWWFYGRFGALFAIDMWPDWNKKSLVCTFQNYCSSFSACGDGTVWGLAFLSLGLIYVNAPSHLCSFILFCFFVLPHELCS